MLLTINDLLVFIVAQIHQSHVFNVDRRLWLQQMAEGPPSIMQPFSRSKVHGIKLYKKTRSANKKNLLMWCCSESHYKRGIHLCGLLWGTRGSTQSGVPHVTG